METNKISCCVENFIPSEMDADETINNNSIEKNIVLNTNLNYKEESISKINENNNINEQNSSNNNNEINSNNTNNNSINKTNKRIKPIHRKNNSIFSYDNNSKDKSFKRLQIIQKLLKKESALKELFIKTSSETLKSIEKECREIYKKKLDVFSTLQKFSRKEKDIRKYFLVDEQSQKDNLKDLNNYIPKFLLYLWDEPELIVKLLQKSKISDIKNHLAPLLTNNFY